MTNEERLRGEVSTLREALEFYADAVSYATKYMQHGLATEAAPVVIDNHGDIARRALTTDFGKPEAEVIAAAEHEFADPEFGDVSYDLGQIVAKWDGRILEELVEQFVAYLQKSGYPCTIQAVERMREART